MQKILLIWDFNLVFTNIYYVLLILLLLYLYVYVCMMSTGWLHDMFPIYAQQAVHQMWKVVHISLAKNVLSRRTGC